MESEVIGLQSLFEFQIDSVTDKREVLGALRPTGLRPSFLDKFHNRGIKLPTTLFNGAGAASLAEPVRAVAGAIGQAR